MLPGKKTPFVALIFLAFTVLASCGQTAELSPETTEGEPQTKKVPATDTVDMADPLAGTEWKLRSLRGEDLVEGTNITLDIEESSYRGNATCNWYGGRYTSGNGFPEVSRIDMTQMGCPEGQQEITSLNTLQNAATYRLRDDSLELRNPAGETVLVYTRKPRWDSNPAELVDTRWKLHSLNGKSPEEGSVPTLSFDSEKRYSGYDGCLRFYGTYDATRDDLELPVLGMKELDCMKPVSNGGYDALAGAVPPDGDYRLNQDRLESRTVDENTYIFVPLTREADVQGMTPWKLEKFVENGAAKPVLAGTEITIVFDGGTLRKRGAVRGSGGCNTYRAGYVYRSRPGTIEGPDFRDPDVTRKLCRTPENTMEQERRYLSFLEDARNYYPENDRLRLETGDGRKLVFSASG